MTLRELMITLGFKLDKNSEKQVENAITGLKNKAIMALGTIGVGLAVNELIQIGDEFTNTNARLSLINDGLRTQEELQKRVLKVANDTRQAYTATANMVSKLRLNNAKLFDTADKALQLAKTINQALIVGGASTMESESTILQLSQAMAAGRLQGDEFRSIAENAPVLMQMISEGIGKSRGELKEMSKDGELTAELIYEALSKMSWKVDDMFKKIPVTFGQATQIAKNRWGSFIAKINSDSGILQKAGKLILETNEAILDTLEKIIDTLGGFELALKKILLLVTAIWFAMNMDKLRAIMTYLRKGIIYLREQWMIASRFPGLYRTQVMWQLKQLGITIANIAAWLALFLIVEDFIAFLQGKDSVIGDMLTGMGVDTEQVRKSFEGITKAIGKAAEWIGKHTGVVMTIVYGLLFLIGVIKILTVVTTIFSIVMNSAMWPVLLVIAIILVLAGLVYVVIRNWGTIVQFFKDLWEAVKQAFVSFFQFIWGLLDNQWVQAALLMFAPFIGLPLVIIKNWRKILTFFQGLWKGLKPIFEGIGNFFGRIFGGESPVMAMVHSVQDARNPNPSTVRTMNHGGNYRTNNVQTKVEINNTFNGNDRENQLNSARAMERSGNDIMGVNARALAYGR